MEVVVQGMKIKAPLIVVLQATASTGHSYFLRCDEEYMLISKTLMPAQIQLQKANTTHMALRIDQVS